ncbi:hypothetical protein JW766_03495 [Candidatus Dojkabacteria bacterium]|nr:hypothetical protein [Candidatus Dojkabacteria bacterium]
MERPGFKEFKRSREIKFRNFMIAVVGVLIVSCVCCECSSRLFQEQRPAEQSEALVFVVSEYVSLDP